MAEPVLRAAWPNGNSGGARTRTDWRTKIAAKGSSHTCIFRSPWRGRWFSVLFAVLPVGDRSQHETGDIAAETDPGAPVAPRLVGKAIGTTLISGVVFAALVAFADYAG